MNSRATGERLEVTDLSENTAEHLHRYAFARTYCSGKIVLDIASGEGYGSHLLAEVSAKVTGVDIDPETVKLAREKYRKPNLEFLVGNAAEIPCNDNSFDIVTSFETLEHHDRHNEMFSEIKRVLKPGGICIISTPDKLIYSDEKNYHNPFHVKELYKQEFRELVSSWFSNVILLRQRFMASSLLVPDETGTGGCDFFSGDYTGISSAENIKGEYLVAVASDQGLTPPAMSLFTDEEFIGRKLQAFRLESVHYKIGRWITSPVRIIKKLFNAGKK